MKRKRSRLEPWPFNLAKELDLKMWYLPTDEIRKRATGDSDVLYEVLIKVKPAHRALIHHILLNLNSKHRAYWWTNKKIEESMNHEYKERSIVYSMKWLEDNGLIRRIMVTPSFRVVYATKDLCPEIHKYWNWHRVPEIHEKLHNRVLKKVERNKKRSRAFSEKKEKDLRFQEERKAKESLQKGDIGTYYKWLYSQPDQIEHV